MSIVEMQQEGLSRPITKARWVIANVKDNGLAQRTLRQLAVGISNVASEDLEEVVANVFTRLYGAVHDA